MPKKPELDADFERYVVDSPSLTYVQPTDTAFRRFIIDRLEKILGRGEIEDIYNKLKEAPFDIQTFFDRAIKESKINIEHLGLQPEELKHTEGPLVFVANHPFGILDGTVLCDLAAQVRGDLRIMINSALCQDRDLAPYFLPIDFEQSQKAIRTNIKSKKLALENLSDDVPVLIFPSGMVSTAKKFGFGSVKDAPWTTFAAKLVRESKATVVPVYFHGQNSRKFHIGSHLAEPLRMGMLMHEATNKFGRDVPVTIGHPIAWDEIKEIQGRQELTDVLYAAVQALKHSKVEPDGKNSIEKLVLKIRALNRKRREKRRAKRSGKSSSN